MTAVEARLAGRGGQFFVGNRLTWADLMVFSVSLNLATMGQSLTNVPLIQNLVARVGDIPNVKKWIAERPVTAF